LKSEAKLIAKKECGLKLIKELQHLYFDEKIPIWQLSRRFKLKWNFIYRTLKKWG
jgi:transposase-like protein